MFEGKSHSRGTGLRFLQQGRVLDLRLVDQFRVVPKDQVAQLGVFIQPHGAPDKGIELFDEKVGQLKGGDFPVFGVLRKGVVAFKERIAMGAGNHLDTQVGAYPLQLAASAAIGIDHIDLIID